MTDYSEIPLTGFVPPLWVKKRYAISNSTMYSWISRNFLPAPVKIGPRAVRFRAEDIQRFEAKLMARDGEGR